MIPVVGGLKEWYELDTGKDAFTGLGCRGMIISQAFGIVANFLPVVHSGPAALLEGGGEATFIGAGEQGLMEVGAEEEAVAAENVVAVNFQEEEAVAQEETVNLADTGTGGRTYAGGSGPMNTEETAGAGNTIPEQGSVWGNVTPPQGNFGSGNFGNAMHQNIADWLEEKFPNVNFDISIKPGQTGVDITVPDANVGTVGFKYGEIKPNTVSGQKHTWQASRKLAK
jgi:hypothetical protein